MRFARLKRPVYITETGIADKADTLRGEWAESYFKAVRVISASCCMHPRPGCLNKDVQGTMPYHHFDFLARASYASGHPQNSTVTGQVEHAVADGYDVRGLMYWTLVDNFEVGLPLPTGPKLSTLAPHEMRNHQGSCNDCLRALLALILFPVHSGRLAGRQDLDCGSGRSLSPARCVTCQSVPFYRA